jgi:hypothetical protein
VTDVSGYLEIRCYRPIYPGHGSVIDGDAPSRQADPAAWHSGLRSIRGRTRAGYRQRVAVGGRTPLPWRISLSVIDSTRPVNADYSSHSEELSHSANKISNYVLSRCAWILCPLVRSRLAASRHGRAGDLPPAHTGSMSGCSRDELLPPRARRGQAKRSNANNSS